MWDGYANSIEMMHVMAAPSPTAIPRFARWRPLVWTTLAALLALPMVAMQLTDEVNWGAFDFLFAALLLLLIGLAFEVAARIEMSAMMRLAVMGLTTGAVLVIWAEAAVGIF